MHKRGRLVTSDGLEIAGQYLYEGGGIVEGELVFSTSTTGYTEILTDPSFYGQIVVLACPEVGNYGININDFQSDGIKVKGLVVRNLSSCTSSFRAHMSLADVMLKAGVPILYGVDTRAVITHLRDHGSKMAVMCQNPSITSFELFVRAQSARPLEEQKLSDAVSVSKPQKINVQHYDLLGQQRGCVDSKFHVVAIDFGIKRAILRCLQHVGITTTLVPNNTTPEEIWALKPDGVFLSNGPGDPGLEKEAVATVQNLLGKLPIFGVCMGHQILAQALGLSTYKLKFGHRGSNQAARCQDGKIITTAQNHGYAVKAIGNPSINHATCNVSDGTNEGIDVPSMHAFSVQFHPEGAPGPLDSLFYFEKFATLLQLWKSRSLLVSTHDMHVDKI